MCGHRAETDDSRAKDAPSGLSRRSFLRTGSLAVASGALNASVLPSVRARATPKPVVVGTKGQTQVYLLGAQGGQNRSLIQGSNVCAGPSVLLLVNGAGYLLDAGVGSLLRLAQAGFDPTIVSNIFMTHHHQDHNADLGNFMGFGWTTGRFGASTRTLGVWGPTGTKKYCSGYRGALELSINDQQQNLGQTPTFSSFLRVHDFGLKGKMLTQPVEVMSDGNVKVSAIRVNHGALPTVGYRFETPDLDVAFSGDRGNRGDDFVALAAGADVLFHEIIDIDTVLPVLKKQNAPADFIEHQEHDHAPPSLVAATAKQAGVPKLVLYHLIPANLGVTSDARWMGLVSATYPGEIVVGQDLLEIT